MLDWAQMMLATVGVGGVAALWVVKALLGVSLLRAWRRWRNRRAVLAAPEV